MNRQLLGARGGQLLPLEPVDGGQQQLVIVRQLLTVFLASTRVHDGGKVVHAQVLIHELPGDPAEVVCARDIRMQIVEEQQVETAPQLWQEQVHL